MKDFKCARLDEPISMEFREGQFLVTPEGLVFEVKGVLHPKDRVIAYLRYVPDPLGKRKNRDGCGYRKVYDLRKREEYLKENFPDYLWYDSINGRLMQAVHKSRIRKVMDPVQILRELRSGLTELNRQHEIVLELTERLVRSAAVGWNAIGVTGSLLADLPTPMSDIDLVIYGTNAARRVYETISRHRKRVGIKPYQGERLLQHVVRRWGVRNARYWSILMRIEAKKILQGTFRGVDVYVRAVKLPNEMRSEYGDVSFERGSRARLHGRIRNTAQSIFTPCEYEIVCHERPAVKRIVSFRGRFTEQVRVDDEIVVEGTIERVRGTREVMYERMILGENDSDILLPIR